MKTEPNTILRPKVRVVAQHHHGDEVEAQRLQGESDARPPAVPEGSRRQQAKVDSTAEPPPPENSHREEQRTSGGSSLKIELREHGEAKNVGWRVHGHECYPRGFVHGQTGGPMSDAVIPIAAIT